MSRILKIALISYTICYAFYVKSIAINIMFTSRTLGLILEVYA